ncbi:CTTNBP2 N-terminal-like protein [Neocloeon triangulifer]|uniref:CTTNBP2 N-terminal-like protein n=1 Tax=Neocloeon triangulifer TaxID=2078957 RepID=UPI00286FAECF|nr:CTTNBP2 N-terminal-like protein [Neocloeon triangulifer]
MQAEEGNKTLKRNPKVELGRSDLLKLLGHLEGELQARDVVIAALKCERVKQLLIGSSRVTSSLAALQRDGSLVRGPKVDEGAIKNLADRQLAALENLIVQNRRVQVHMNKVLKETEERHVQVVNQLDKMKLAMQDDAESEAEKARLRQELEVEKQEKMKLEEDLKKIQEQLEEERNRQKQIVLLLLADRRKVIMKYIEERKRSEDLAQILSEEKARVDSMAEGLEEESKRALQMEADLEKHHATFQVERQQLKAALAKEEKRAREAEIQLEAFKRKFAEVATMGRPQSSSTLVTKVVQPTATVSSKPVSAPVTGIARSVASAPVSRIAESPQVVQMSPHVSLQASPGTKVFTSTNQDGRVTYHVKSAVAPPLPAAAKKPPLVPPAAGRGAPPPIPPNKPVVPPKSKDLETNKTLSIKQPPRKT